jgi:hypothetical protein
MKRIVSGEAEGHIDACGNTGRRVELPVDDPARHPLPLDSSTLRGDPVERDKRQGDYDD